MTANKFQRDSYHAAARTVGDVVILTDGFGRILYFNGSAVEAMFGYQPEELIGLPMRTLLPDLRGSLLDGSLRRYLVQSDGANGTVSRTVSGRRRNGEGLPLDLSIADWHDKTDGLCFSWVLRDVTERVRLKAQLRAVAKKAAAAVKTEHQLLKRVRESNAELKMANEGLQKFTSIVAHDLRGPLRRIEAFVGVLQEDFSDDINDEGANILERIASGAARMKLMLDSLLQYSRYNSAAIAGKTANLAHVIRDALSAFDAGGLGVEVRISMIGVTDADGDTVLLSHVLQNLIGNAIKFRSADRPRITIEAWREGQEIRMSVADNGIGIEPKFAEKIFEMFSRLHDDEEYEGTGIGLAVCRKIINDHGGRIWLDTDAEGETRFAFTLTAAEEADVDVAAPTMIFRGMVAAA